MRPCTATPIDLDRSVELALAAIAEAEREACAKMEYAAGAHVPSELLDCQGWPCACGREEEAA